MADFPGWLDPSTLPPGYQPQGEAPSGFNPYADPSAALAAGGYGSGNVQPMGPGDRGAPPNLAVPGNQLLDPNTGLPVTPDSAATPPGAPPPGVAGPAQPAQPDQVGPVPPTIDSVRAPGDVTGSQTDEAKALNEESRLKMAAAGAQFDAGDAAQRRMADAWNKSADQVTREQETFAMAREAAHRQASAENAEWATQMDAQAAKQPDHHHWWENQSSFGKALYLAGLAFSTYGASKVYGAKNPAADMMMKAIDDDVAEQKERLSRQTQALRERGTQMRQDQASKVTDLQDTYSKKIMRLETVRQALLEQAKQPGPADRQAALLRAQGEIEAAKTKILAQRTENSVKQSEGALARASEERKTANTNWTSRANNNDTIKGENQRNADTLQKDRDLAQISASAKLAEKSSVDLKDIRGTSQELGVTMIGEDGKPTDFKTHKDSDANVKAGQIAQAANQRMDDLAYIQKAIKNDTFTSLMTGKDAEMNARIVRLSYDTAKSDDPSSKVSDNDFSFAVKQNFGYDMTGGVVDKAKFAMNKAATESLIKDEMRSMPQRVANKLQVYNDTLLNGSKSHLIWTPKSMEAPEAPGHNATQALRDAGLPVKLEVPRTPEEFRKAKDLEATDPAFKGQVIAPYDESRIRDLHNDFVGATPANIADLTKQALKEYEGNSRDAWNGKPAQTASDLITTNAIKTQAADDTKVAEKALVDFEDHLKAIIHTPLGAGFTREHIQEIGRKEYGLTNMRPSDWTEALTKAGVLN